MNIKKKKTSSKIQGIVVSSASFNEVFLFVLNDFAQLTLGRTPLSNFASTTIIFSCINRSVSRIYKVQ